MLYNFLVFFALLANSGSAFPFDERQIDYNLNTNKNAQNPLQYSGEWEGHTYFPSPDNWRFPIYTFFLDRWVDGDPTNNDNNGTVFEHDPTSNQLRHGGDVQGVVDSLDYLQGMGVKGIYVAGTPFINLPSKIDGYSPIDFTLLDHHTGTIAEWRDAVEQIHKRGMYIILDTTGSTMADLIGFEGYLNTSAPFLPQEHQVRYKSTEHYVDFAFDNTYDNTCEYPRFWNTSGQRVLQGCTEADDECALFDQLKGCYDSEFDQYGDTQAFGVFPDWQRQLSKFASVQDRLREWKPSVNAKIQTMICLAISQLDIDGFRFDKATQMTVDAAAEIAASLRACARKHGKENFFLPGEITGGNDFGSIYVGRGREPDQRPKDINTAVTLKPSDNSRFLRDDGLQNLDAAAFHYSMAGQHLTAGFDVPPNFVDIWNIFLTTNDFINANTGEFDPRHMYGTSNQDVFRWPAIKDGVDRQLLGQFMTTLHMPGIPLLLWGEEQAMYILDSTASNYVFGRQPISSAPAWQMHGCYMLGSSQYANWPVEKALYGCHDNQVSLDHRDPSHPVRNIIKAMYELRENYVVLQDGFSLLPLTNQTHFETLNGSDFATEFGLWSTVRTQYDLIQDLSGEVSVWLVYQNEPEEKTYQFDCTNDETALFAPYPGGTTVKNLFSPYEEILLEKGPGKQFFVDKSQEANGCLSNFTLDKYGFKAFVPVESWIAPSVSLTDFKPGHDARLPSAPTVDIEFQFSGQLDCESVTNSITITSTIDPGQALPQIEPSSVQCSSIPDAFANTYGVYIPSAWIWKATLTGVKDGIHEITLDNVVGASNATTGSKPSVDHLMFRIGQQDNPMVFPGDASLYSRGIYNKNDAGDLVVTHTAPGADLWRYSTNWASSWSPWMKYTGGQSTIQELHWNGTDSQKWSGDHVILQHWSKMAGSSDHIQHADVNWDGKPPRLFPHVFAQGAFNKFGFDGGLPNKFEQTSQDGVGQMSFHLSTEWKAGNTSIQMNVWGMDPDGQPDAGWVYGDADGDMVLDRNLPGELASIVLNFTEVPPSPYTSFRVQLDETKLRYTLLPAGSRLIQIIVFALLWLMPILTAAGAIWIYMGAFYKIKFNKVGISTKGFSGMFGFLGGKRSKGFEKLDEDDFDDRGRGLKSLKLATLHSRNPSRTSLLPVVAEKGSKKRRTVLIATMEYDIEDWAIKIKIGGLGVMAQLMGKALTDNDLIWVVPCVGGIDYPVDQVQEPMTITVLGKEYEVEVQHHQLKNITYVLLDAPVFRQQSKTEPYPPRMDDLDSAIYYSAWNACIAETVKRFDSINPIDIYHINDYHGAAAPLYLLPRTIPCCLSLHNAEFQGLWPMRNKEEQEEVCKAFNLSKEIVEKYVQFGEVFNLLHAGASYLRVHQKGFGAVGVSNKYGPRSYARYPIFWGLKEIGKLPNPDPSDTEPWDPEEEARQVITVDPKMEAARGDLRRQAQEWAGLKVDPNAELFVFVGRWSVQKGVDLIADCFPAVLEKHKNVQLIAVGPVIDLHGKFAALKLEQIMKKYPGRVYSKPEFTALPPYIFSGAEFALIPSRDEPFGLVAVEFGRKGALGVGARVGGLGQMPGWWFTVESSSSKHMISQFKTAIEDALSSSTAVRADMRARSAKQRFPVAKWVEDLNTLQSASIRIHDAQRGSSLEVYQRPTSSRNVSTDRLSIYEQDANESQLALEHPGPAQNAGGLGRTLSLGKRAGPGHRAPAAEQNLVRLSNIGENGDENDEVEISTEEADRAFQNDGVGQALRQLEGLDAAMMRARRMHSRQRSDEFGQDDSEDQEGSRRGRSRYFMPPPPLGAPEVELFSPGGSHTPAPWDPSAQAADASRSRSPSPMARESLLPNAPRARTLSPYARPGSAARHSMLSINDVTEGRHDYKLQKTELNFTDSTGEYHDKFQKMLEEHLNAKTSESTLVIDDFLKLSEKEWSTRYREAKLGKSRNSSPALGNRMSMHSRHSSFGSRRSSESDYAESLTGSTADEFLLGSNFKRPSFLKRWMQYRILDWPVYSIFLALGQIMAANSYQIVLLTDSSGKGGASGQTEKLYIIGGIYIVGSALWWTVFRTLTPRFVLSIPFVLYGLAFLFIGIAPFFPGLVAQEWARNVATGLYSTGSSSGAFFFALNFGDEGGAPIKSWIFRATLVQGLQSNYIAGLFYFGEVLTAAQATGNMTPSITDKPIIAAIAGPVAGLLLGIAVLLFFALPPYYRQMPGKVPQLYQSLLRRKLIIWMFVSVVLQNYWLSAPYGRNWAYLWSSIYAPRWAIGILVLVFFVGVWAVILIIFAQLSKTHSWILPMFAFGLLAPRWAQMWWGISSFGLWLPWMPGGPVAGAIAGRSLWLWLGVLDAIQGVGIGMALLQTLTRIHVALVLVTSQLIGAAITLIAKASAPDKNGPGPVFPDLSAGVVPALSSPWFWVALVCQLAIPVGFFFWFRKEQLSKP